MRNSGKYSVHVFKPSGRAFTLIELLVVVGIIGLFIAIIIPTLAWARKSAKRSVCFSNQREIMKAVFLYSSQYNGKLPYSGRQFPYMAMMDFYETLMYGNMCQTIKYAHCPADNFTPGYWAQWWVTFNGVTETGTGLVLTFLLTFLRHHIGYPACHVNRATRLPDTSTTSLTVRQDASRCSASQRIMPPLSA